MYEPMKQSGRWLRELNSPRWPKLLLKIQYAMAVLILLKMLFWDLPVSILQRLSRENW